VKDSGHVYAQIARTGRLPDARPPTAPYG